MVLSSRPLGARRSNLVHSLNRALSLFPLGTRMGSDRGMMALAVRSDAVHCPYVRNRTHIAPTASCIVWFACHLELKWSSSISGTAERRVRRIEAVRVFGTIVQSNFYQLIV
jgi:hypothetical protein